MFSDQQGTGSEGREVLYEKNAESGPERRDRESHTVFGGDGRTDCPRSHGTNALEVGVPTPGGC